MDKTVRPISIDPLIYHSFIYDSSGYIYWKNSQLEYIACNYNLAKASGMNDPSEIVGKTDYDFEWGRQKANSFREDDRYVLETGEAHISEYELPLPTKIAWIRTEKRPWYNEKREIVGIVGIAFDVSLEKTNKLLRKEKNALNHHANQVKSIAHSISHDLKTPLWSIQLGIDNLEKTVSKLIRFWQFLHKDVRSPAGVNISTKDIENTQLSLKAIGNQIQFVNEFNNNMVASVNPGYLLTHKYDCYSINEIIFDSVEDYPCSGNQQNLLHIDFKVDFKFWGDKNLLKALINNLLNNAFFAITTKGKGEIYITTKETPSSFEVLFKDTAGGTTEEITKKMFQSHFSTKKSGHGLGLSFCNLIMQSFGGAINVRNCYDKYIEFTLSFPKGYQNELDETENRREPTLPG